MSASPATATAVRTDGIKVSNLHKSFVQSDRRVDVLANLSIEIEAGSFVTVVGPSGCGKSTLMHIIAGLENPTSGTVHWADRGGRPVPEDFGYMFQKDLLLPWLKVGENVALGLRVGGTSQGEARGQALAILEQYGLAEFVDAYPFQLSGGMRQRAALMRTLLMGRGVILLDEPFGGLDALTKLSMQQWLISLWERDRHTVLFITHDVNEAVFLSDRVIALSPRPARIVLDADINIPRPRTEATFEDATFIEHAAQIRSTIMRLEPHV
ncbi:MAG: ABC transporter ATP-binding protein [Solirubrobacteraceae bacterium]